MAIFINQDLCKSCKLCIDICPKNVFELSGKTNKKGYDYITAAREEDCIKCRMCQNTCPDMVIFVEK